MPKKKAPVTSGALIAEVTILKRCQSVSCRYWAASPVEQIIDTDREHLDIAISGGESVGADAGNHNSVARVVQPEEIVFQFRRPVLRERIFDTRAQQPATVGVAVGKGNRGARPNVGNGKISRADPTAAGLAVEERMINRNTEAGSQSR
jgi:hypothetical protein